MCGLVGIYHPTASRPVDRALVEAMNQRQFHRGPDDGGVFIGPGIGLGHRRLSIVDLGGGRQPMTNDGGGVVLVYNGELYNNAELVAELQAAGHVFRTASDTETVIHAWEEWGEDSVCHLRGMFAYALWDDRGQTLFLARDRLGIKPLHYTCLADGRVMFGSELKSLTGVEDIPKVVDPLAIEDFLAYGYVPDPRSIFKDILKLEAGHTLTFRRGEAPGRPQCYWDVKFTTPSRPAKTDDLCAEVIDRLDEAVRCHLVADVPVGAFLSGGVDSSAMVALMAGATDRPVETCSIAFSEARFDESAYAKTVAERYGTHHRVHTLPAQTLSEVGPLTAIYDEPFADSSALPTLKVCQAARETVTVALSGDGGDELFAGYRRYRFHTAEEAVRRILPQAARGPLFGALGRVYPKLDWAPQVLRAKSTFQALGRDRVEGYFNAVSVIPDGLRRGLYSKTMRAELAGYGASEVLRRHMTRAPADHPLSVAQYVDLKTWLPGDILTKVDRASMATSLEVRVPMLDHRFVEWTAGLSPDLKLSGGTGKYLLKRALRPLLPDDVLYRRKMGFSIPLADWLRGPWSGRTRALAGQSALVTSGLFDGAAVAKLVERHLGGNWDHGAALYALIVLDDFLAAHVGAACLPARMSA
ncbi:asparagine synthetase B [Rhodospirillum rubrum]|uniref:XrtA/PEP-CTERM system amidotransferase n=1 Tax=Rhodospirillum rubrum TaxID=1085 RepID=UPI001905CEB6|nr:XrtA/PEP-CTERM system amidotransferase [Rhodospirillum rubrum]MBK1665186.1 asparagine synthetase B [Rhodospirillum rubrum]MBK1677808.1 asparagine synthetase B [Rhodospirillum rubrum]